MSEFDRDELEGAQGEDKLLEMREDESPRKRGLSPRVKKEIREWIVSLAVALIVFFIVRTFIFTVIRVDGDSMLETLRNGDRMIVTIIDRKIFGVGHGDVIICRYPNRTQYFVKRVVGLGGDTIEVRGGTTYRNGEALDEPYITNRANYDFGPYEVPEGMVFVLGDNRANSHDSHSRDVGPLEDDQIIGIARWIMWPLSDIGPVTKVSGGS